MEEEILQWCTPNCQLRLLKEIYEETQPSYCVKTWSKVWSRPTEVDNVFKLPLESQHCWSWNEHLCWACGSIEELGLFREMACEWVHYINHVGQHAEDTGCFKLFLRQDPSIKPFIFLDGHSSRLKLPFLKYNNDPKDHWVACIGVPYGTAL